ncbi:hypothetical protein DL237_10220 [Pseudooceanicola sediminis]|uniref:FAS1-like dehydratase domain-containing protein n=1 Tax=Pseudooceanicola sediminis TaxID=2211117 RepID=A0A399J3U7_9RHOB|nr:MaoC family dehydratase N-terminal domain-containing protein [Pseudooceanicola sediminis]KAA2313813.1 MaoC family dehydratase [Puniceibacterium sp. HSS470]RII38632.1 hypothetical protein DL237_10220 [Pseudooceanicola sediminis]|tara:strand:- start:4313 stop:4813 length:501 start_codon:yes stop_codon:yes gene_type:complete
MSDLLSDEIRALIGAERYYPAHEEIGGAAIRYFAIAVGDTDPIYVDDAAARRQGYSGRIAPPTFVVETGQYAGNTPSANGYIPHEWPWPKGFRTIRGGQDYVFKRPIVPSDRISVRYRLESVEAKSSRDGRGQLLAVSLAEYLDAAGAIVATNRELFFLQPLEAGQ